VAASDAASALTPSISTVAQTALICTRIPQPGGCSIGDHPLAIPCPTLVAMPWPSGARCVPPETRRYSGCRSLAAKLTEMPMYGA